MAGNSVNLFLGLASPPPAGLFTNGTCAGIFNYAAVTGTCRRSGYAVGEGALSISNLDLNVILNMPSGPEMDALVAKEVMGYAVDFEELPSATGDATRVWFIVPGENQLSRSKIPKFSTDIEAAWKIGKKMRLRGDALSLQHRNMIDNAPGTAIWTAWFGRANDLAWAASPSLAICRAALLAVRSGKQPSKKPVEGNLFSVIERELAKIMGPIAHIIVDDKIADFGESKDTFPEDRVDAFVKAIGEEITDSSERASFVAAMGEFLLPKHWSGKQPSKKPVEGNLFSVIERELAKIMGPIAHIIVDDKIADFGESKDTFPEDRVDAFVKAIGEEITDSSERASFVAAMGEFLLPKHWSGKQPSKKPVEGNLFSVIERELAKIMGPIAHIIVDDKIADFGESKDTFPEDRVDAFVKAIGEEITDSSERASFVAAMGEFLLPKHWSGKQPSKKPVEGNLFSVIERELAKIMG